jgi:hypothetical protein
MRGRKNHRCYDIRDAWHKKHPFAVKEKKAGAHYINDKIYVRKIYTWSLTL